MALVYSNDSVEDLIWSALEPSRCAQDFLDFMNQFPDSRSACWVQALSQAVATFSPIDPKSEQQVSCYPAAFARLSALAQETEQEATQAIAYFHLGKMHHLGLGTPENRDESIRCYKRAIALGDIRSLVNCGGHYDGPNASPEDLEFAQSLYQRACERGEPLGLARMADRIDDEKDPRKYALYLQAADMGLAYGMYQVGVSIYFGRCGQAEDRPLGLSWLQRAARAGWAPACNMLGYLHEGGASKDLKLAWDWRTLGATLGSAACMHAIGLKFLLGIDRETNTAEALKWFYKAAVLGDKLAQFRIGQHHLISEDQSSQSLGVAWMKLSSDNGYRYGSWRLALAYRDGVGCERNLQEAARYCEIAARDGLPEAQGQLGLFYWYGNGVERDYDKAYQWLQMSALQGDSYGLFLFGLATEKGVGCSPNSLEAIRLYEEAAEKGELDAINKIGDCFYFGNGKPKDPVQAALWYRRAAAQGHALSMADLGRMLCDGEGVLTNYEEAFKWFTKAADLNEPTGMFMLAVLYANGDGVEQSDEQCRRWMGRAAMLGHQPAKDWMQANLPAAPQWLDQLVNQTAPDQGAKKTTTDNSSE